jgi:hypothetical protein
VVEEASVVVASMVAVAVVSVEEVWVVALWLPDMLEVESVAVVAESASAEHICQVAPVTLLAQDPGSLRLVIHRPDSLSTMDGLIDLFPPTSWGIVA